MKTRNLLIATLLFAFGAVACEGIIDFPEKPIDDPRTFTIKLRAGGEADVSYEPLTRFTPDDRDLYGVQVRHKPATTGSYKYYAYGLFDSLDDVELEVKENYMYEFEVKLIDDGKDKIYCDSVLVDSNYYLGYDKPFRARNKYNAASAESITQLTNRFTYDEDKYFVSDTYIKTSNGKEYEYPEGVDFYYGKVSDYIATEDGAVLSIYLKHMVFGLKVNIGDFFDNGKITLSAFDKTYTFMPEGKLYETTYAYYNDFDAAGDPSYMAWYTTDDLSNTRFTRSLAFTWTKDDGTTIKWKTFSPKFYRLRQTTINLNYYGEDGVLGTNSFDLHYEDTEIEEDYINYSHGSEQDDYNW